MASLLLKRNGFEKRYSPTLLNAESVAKNSHQQPNSINAPSAGSTFDGGAVRSEKLPPLEDIPLSLLLEIGKRFAMGEEKYGRDNWKRGGPEFFRQAYAHAIRHLMLAANRNESEESILSNLGAAAWGIGILIEWETNLKHKWNEN